MASAEEALAAFRAAVGEEEFERLTAQSEIERLTAGGRPKTSDDPEIERLAKLAD